ncbi:MAG: rRNA maturation RNase YbeY [Phycisphaeraceae bacterium]|nr:rRNA maturation RNase YbeY [Phycisphaeraceae bacterium]
MAAFRLPPYVGTVNLITKRPVDSRSFPPPVSRALDSAAYHIELALHVKLPEPSLDSWLKESLAKILRAAALPEASVSLVIVDDRMMSDLHQRFLQDDSTTDVLTFDLRDDAAQPIDVELVLCLDEAARQAAVRQVPVQLELLLYAVHGLLHCCGHDDHDPAAAAAMHRREDELLIAAGFPPVYAGSRQC